MTVEAAGNAGGPLRTVSAHTFDCDDVHALHGIKGAQAGIDRAVDQLVILAAGHHDCAGAAAALPAAQLGACQAHLCSGHSRVMEMHSRCMFCAHAVLGRCNWCSSSSSCWLASCNVTGLASPGRPLPQAQFLALFTRAYPAAIAAESPLLCRWAECTVCHSHKQLAPQQHQLAAPYSTLLLASNRWNSAIAVSIATNKRYTAQDCLLVEICFGSSPDQRMNIYNGSQRTFACRERLHHSSFITMMVLGAGLARVPAESVVHNLGT